MADWRIRHARPDDIPSMVVLLDKLFSMEQDFSVNAQKQHQGLGLLLQQNAELACIFVAEKDQQLVAMCSIQSIISTAMGGRAGLLEDLIVDENCRGRGIGQALLGAVYEWCQQQGIQRIQLQADRGNHKALAFYQKQGWQQSNLCTLAQFMFDK